MKFQSKWLINYTDSLQAKGQYTFTGANALATFPGTPNAFKLAALRLIKKNKLLRLKHGFYVIIPTEYQEVEAPPAAWFIDSLMRFTDQPYYVGILSAAALHGAAHQQPQVFQVVTTKFLRPIQAGRTRIEFFTKKQILQTNYQSVKTPTGYMQISTPEITALDLVRYMKSIGHLNHIATVLSELHETLDATQLLNILKSDMLENATIQRLGYLLELLNADKKIVALLKEWVIKRKPRAIPLRADKAYDISQKNRDWFLYINETIESDL